MKDRSVINFKIIFICVTACKSSVVAPSSFSLLLAMLEIGNARVSVISNLGTKQFRTAEWQDDSLQNLKSIFVHRAAIS